MGRHGAVALVVGGLAALALSHICLRMFTPIVSIVAQQQQLAHPSIAVHMAAAPLPIAPSAAAIAEHGIAASYVE